MGGIEITLTDWEGLQKKLLDSVEKKMEVVDKLSERIEKTEIKTHELEEKHTACSNETNQRLKNIEGLLTKGKNVILKWAGKGFVIGYRALALYLLYRLTSVNPDLATAAKNILLP